MCRCVVEFGASQHTWRTPCILLGSFHCVAGGRWSENANGGQPKLGFGKGSFGKGVFSENPLSEILQNLMILEILENPRLWKKGESDHCLEILENLEILDRDSRDSSSERPLS